MVHGALSLRTGWAAIKKRIGAAGCAALRLAWRAAIARTAGRRSQRQRGPRCPHMLGRRPGGSAATWLRIRATMSPMPVPKIAVKIQALAVEPTPPMAPKRHRSLATSAASLSKKRCAGNRLTRRGSQSLHLAFFFPTISIPEPRVDIIKDVQESAEPQTNTYERVSGNNHARAGKLRSGRAIFNRAKNT